MADGRTSDEFFSRPELDASGEVPGIRGLVGLRRCVDQQVPPCLVGFERFSTSLSPAFGGPVNQQASVRLPDRQAPSWLITSGDRRGIVPINRFRGGAGLGSCDSLPALKSFDRRRALIPGADRVASSRTGHLWLSFDGIERQHFYMARK